MNAGGDDTGCKQQSKPGHPASKGACDVFSTSGKPRCEPMHSSSIKLCNHSDNIAHRLMATARLPCEQYHLNALPYSQPAQQPTPLQLIR